MYISTSWTRSPLRSCKYIQAFTSLGECDIRRVTMRKDSPKNMAKKSLMLHLQRVSCTVYHRYRREYIKITEYMPEKNSKVVIFLPLTSRKNNNLCPVISYIATRITLNPRVWFLRIVLQHDDNAHMEAP